ncbi:hypothetical protein C8_375 [Cannes 8 virus]|nr:hypothetical protein C8_375 [Cannes 8 virus]
MEEYFRLATFYHKNSEVFLCLSKRERKKFSLFRYCEEKDIPKFSKVPLELFERGKTIAKEKGKMDEFSSVFGRGCIAKNTNSLSQWISRISIE